MQDEFLKKYHVSVVFERQKLLEVPFVYVSKEEMAQPPWNMNALFGFNCIVYFLEKILLFGVAFRPGSK